MSFEKTLHDADMRLMNLIWSEEPIKAKELAALAWVELGWKTTTTYTVLKRLCDRNIIQRKDPEFIVNSLVSKSQVTKEQVSKIVDKLYNGSSKMFLTAFLEQEKLTSEDLSDIRTMLDNYDKKMEE